METAALLPPPVRTVVPIAVSLIDPDLTQPRKTFRDADLIGIGKSMRQSGQLQPIRVRTNYETEGRYIIRCGEQRWRAAQLERLETVDCIIVDDNSDDAAIKLEQLAENLYRSDLPPIELAEALVLYRERTGQTDTELAASLVFSPKWVRQQINLLRLPEPLRGQVNNSDIPLGIAYELAEPDDEVHRSAGIRLYEELRKQKLTVYVTVRRLRAARSGGPVTSKRGKRREETIRLPGLGFGRGAAVIARSGKDMTGEDVAHMLFEALRIQHARIHEFDQAPEHRRFRSQDMRDIMDAAHRAGADVEAAMEELFGELTYAVAVGFIGLLSDPDRVVRNQAVVALNGIDGELRTFLTLLGERRRRAARQPEGGAESQ